MSDKVNKNHIFSNIVEKVILSIDLFASIILLLVLIKLYAFFNTIIPMMSAGVK